MIRTLAASAALAVALLPSAVSAQQVDLSFGATVTSDYISRGLSQTGGRPAVQPFVEVGVGGFYAGVWASNVRFPDSRDRVEVDVYAGFAGVAGPVSYDIGYARYIYNRSGDCCGEILLGLELDAPFGARFGTDLAYDHRARNWAGSVGAGYVFPGGVNVSAEVGREQGSHNFWNVGAGLDLNPQTSVDLRVHDTNITSPRLVASVAFGF
ncbi:MAG: TorF family putative porin [Alkalilacustris sp.]